MPDSMDPTICHVGTGWSGHFMAIWWWHVMALRKGMPSGWPRTGAPHQYQGWAEQAGREGGTGCTLSKNAALDTR